MPDSAPYFYAAYAVAATLYAGYAASVWWRLRQVRERRRGYPR